MRRDVECDLLKRGLAECGGGGLGKWLGEVERIVDSSIPASFELSLGVLANALEARRGTMVFSTTLIFAELGAGPLTSTAFCGPTFAGFPLPVAAVARAAAAGRFFIVASGLSFFFFLAGGFFFVDAVLTCFSGSGDAGCDISCL